MLAEFVSRRLPMAVSAFAIAPDVDAPHVLDDFSRDISQRDADHCLAEYFLYRASMEAGILVVEDDTARAGDPWLTDEVVVVEERVIRWKSLQRDPQLLTELMRRGASGYPLNAYVCDEVGRAILQRSDGLLTREDASSLAQSARAVIHSVFDAESYVVIELGASSFPAQTAATPG